MNKKRSIERANFVSKHSESYELNELFFWRKSTDKSTVIKSNRKKGKTMN